MAIVSVTFTVVFFSINSNSNNKKNTGLPSVPGIRTETDDPSKAKVPICNEFYQNGLSQAARNHLYEHRYERVRNLTRFR